MTADEITITADNLDEIRESISVRDQGKELEVGCRTWGIFYSGGCRGQMTVWPNGRGAICLGGDSVWGDWLDQDGLLYTEDSDAAGNTIAYTADGEEIAIDCDGKRCKIAC